MLGYNTDFALYIQEFSFPGLKSGDKCIDLVTVCIINLFNNTNMHNLSFACQNCNVKFSQRREGLAIEKYSKLAYTDG